MLVAVIEVMYLIFCQEQGCSDAVNWSITPSFIAKATRSVKSFKVGLISLALPQLDGGNLEVGPEICL